MPNRRSSRPFVEDAALDIKQAQKELEERLIKQEKILNQIYLAIEDCKTMLEVHENKDFLKDQLTEQGHVQT